MHKVLLLDFNGVISYKNFWWQWENESHQYFSKRKEITDFLFVDNIEIVKSWMRGNNTAEEICQFVSENTNFPQDELLEGLIESATNIDISSNILEAINNKRETYKLALVTDNMDTFTRFTLPSNPSINSAFDTIYSSNETGLLKQDNGGEIFKRIAEDFSVETKNLALFDDSRKNTDHLDSMGGKGMNVSGEEKVIRAIMDL
jgi:FMN phosphatase YigB (HAD superfamily)